MGTLWLKFAEDSSLPVRMDAQERKRFEAIFDASAPDSLWQQAVRQLGLKAVPLKEPLICWRENTPYIHWSYVVELISAGLVSVVQNQNQAVHYQSRFRLSRLLSLVRSQWNISRYILQRMDDDAAISSEPICESIALGIAILALTMRLPAHTPEQLAGWLSSPATLPLRLRRTVKQMQALQHLRTRLSPAWSAAFPDREPEAVRQMGVDYFWDDAALLSSPAIIAPDDAIAWQGLGVCGHTVNGRAELIARVAASDASNAPAPRVLIFPLARPETVTLFAQADAVLFGEGGVMSHACTVAREMNLPCITGLGRGFIAHIKTLTEAKENIWLSVNPAQGVVTIISE